MGFTFEKIKELAKKKDEKILNELLNISFNEEMGDDEEAE